MKLRLLSLLTVLLLSTGVLSVSAEPALDFDRIDAAKIVGELRHGIRRTPGLDSRRVRMTTWRTERDCAHISFGVNDPLRSESIELESREYRDVCYPSGPNGHQNCYEQIYRSERRRVRVEVFGRGEMLPWERDVFLVCLDGSWLTASVVDASHSYDLTVPGWRDNLISAHAKHKTRSQPDAYGITGDLTFDAASGNFLLGLRDRWARYYASEPLTLELTLKRHHKNWFDETILAKEITLPTAESYTVRYADFAEELKGKLKPGKKYYVNWRFKRTGPVSKNSWQNHRDTEKVEYQGAGTAEEGDWASR